MAKPNPIMKHAKPKLTPEQVAIEDFINSIEPTLIKSGVIQDNITEVIDHVDTSLDPVVDAVEVAESLDDLADDVSGITTAIALESYRRIFLNLTNLTGHPVASLEAFPATKGGVARLTRTIRNHAELLRSAAMLSLEEYADKVDESVGTTLANYKGTLSKLLQLKNNIDIPDKVRFVDLKPVWQIFHRRNEVVSFADFDDEVKGVKELAELVAKGVANIKEMAAKGKDGKALSRFSVIFLLNNTTVDVKDGRAEFKVETAPAATREWTSTDWPIHLAYSLINKEYKGGKGDEQTAVIQSVKAYHRMIEELKRLGPIAEGIAKDVETLTAFIKSQPEDKQKDLKRAASPVLELADNLIKHVIDVTHASMKMFEKLH